LLLSGFLLCNKQESNLIRESNKQDVLYEVELIMSIRRLPFSSLYWYETAGDFL